ncbi:MAG: cytosine deaminase [Intestinibacter sp.]|uniref:cytosine deaminase n=1 Tax=Intestinibacter sp. TaxID=1965304 RepID=UPI002A7F8FF4|nr:cytosine deaminase [Intestinibacter sp.]MDY4575339.1 cytosine deaminase [Intestinibacter sp.]
MLFKNGHIENSVESVDIRVTDGKFEQIGANLEARPGEEVVDCTDKLILPPFVESHVHLDTCLTAGQPRWNMSGTLFEGIERWEERKEFLTKEDVKNRVNKVVRMQAANGVQHVRTHVDINDPKLTALEAILELREEVKDFIDIQIVAFPQYGILSYPKGKELLEEALKMGADAAGAIPHFEFTREYSVESLNICFELAQKYNKLIDVHCDEIDDEASRGLETLATRAYETGMRDMVTASHTTAMHSYNNAYMIRLMRLLKMSGINFVANPCVNMHLGGRVDTYPKRRSLTRVKELTAEGCNVSFGNDDIFDPWNPLGNASMRDAVFMGLYAGHMLGYEEIMNSYKFVTTNAARTLHLGDGYGIKEGNDASFVIMNAKNYYDALNYDEPVLASYKNGKLIAKTEPKKTEVFV